VAHIGSAWSGEEPTSADVDVLLDAVVGGRGAAREDAPRALGDGLVTEIQKYLDDVSTGDDVELFFEVHGRPSKDERGWVLAMLADLRRHGLDSNEAAPLVQRAIDRAITQLR
jgi:hypothetical protein